MRDWVYWVSRFALWVGLKLLFRFRCIGLHHMPKAGGVLVVCNHASYLDPMMLGVGSPRLVYFLARDTLAKVPLLAAWMRAVGVVLVDRNAPSAKAMAAVIERLQAGSAVGVYPEGTRSRTGEVGEFKRGILLLLKKTGATVVPAAVGGSFLALPPGRFFPRLFRRCTLAFGAPMNAEEVLCEGGLDALRKRVAELGHLPLASGEGKATPTSDSEGSRVLRA